MCIYYLEILDTFFLACPAYVLLGSGPGLVVCGYAQVVGNLNLTHTVTRWYTGLPDLHPSLATSVTVERVFSQGCAPLSLQSCLSVQSTQAVLCLGYWSRVRMVSNEDVLRET